MITDNGLILATEEVAPDGGAVASLGADSVALALDLGSTHDIAGIAISDLGSTEMELEVQIDTSFDITAEKSCSFELVSMPIALATLTSATTEGKHTHVTGLTVDKDDDLVDITGHDLPLATPVYFSAGSGGSGLAQNTVYYTTAHSNDGNSFQLASTYDNALAGTKVDQTTADWTGGVLEFLPYVHASTGPISGAFLNAGNRFTARVQPFSLAASPKYAVPNATSQATTRPHGTAGGGIAPAPGRYLALRYNGASLGTTGRISAQLAINTQSNRKFFPSGSAIL